MRRSVRRVRPLVVLVAAIATGVGARAGDARHLQVVQTPGQPPGQTGQTAEATSPPTGVLLGQIVDAGTGAPIAGATVSISGAINPIAAPVVAGGATPPAAPRQVLTGSSGAFLFHDLAKGSYTIRATAPGYLSGAFGQAKPGGGSQTVDLLSDNEKRGDFSIKLWRGATISGTLVDEAGEPVIGYPVRLIRRALVGGKVRFTMSNIATTDDRGVFRLASITPGDYLVGAINSQATMPASTAEAYIALMVAGTSATSDLYRSLSGSGGPGPMMSGTRVGDLLLQNGASGRSGGAGPPPVDENHILVYPTQFFPTARTIAQAAVITLGSGQERSDVNMQLKLVPSVRVSGTLMGPQGPGRNLGLQLVPVGADEFTNEASLEAASTATDGNGAFTFLGVTPGEYTVRCLFVPRPLPSATPSQMTTIEVSGPGGMSIGMVSGPGSTAPAPLPPEPSLWASQSVSVTDSDVVGISVGLRAGARISGKIVFEGSKDPPVPDQLQRTSISFNPMTGGTSFQLFSAAKRVETDGRFSTVGYPPGRYTVSATIPSTPPTPGAPPVPTAWSMKSATFGGKDVSDEGLDLGADDVAGIVITFTDHPAGLTGTVRDDRGQPDTTAAIVVMPADSQVWRQGIMNARRLRNIRASTTGMYTLNGLPPGDYYVAAVKDDSLGEWQDPKVLEKIVAVATHVTITDGNKTSQDLVTRTIR